MPNSAYITEQASGCEMPRVSFLSIQCQSVEIFKALIVTAASLIATLVVIFQQVEDDTTIYSAVRL